MQIASDPPISVKIRKMKERVCWQDPLVLERGIDQTQFVLDDGHQDNPEFSFLVIGDSGSGLHRGYHPQRKIAEQMLANYEGCRFTLHTGDVIYLVGSSEYYPHNFIEPYREFLVGGENPKKIAYNQMVFSKPMLPTPGNHDYYDLPIVYGVLSQLALPFRRLFKSQIDWDMAWHGSFQGKAYAEAFLDYSKSLSYGDFARHLDRHYTAKTNTGNCLRYQPGKFTRLPNRYYQFRYGGVDFFALDSNTFNEPAPLPKTSIGEEARRNLEAKRIQIERKRDSLLETAQLLDPDKPENAEQLDDIRTQLEQLDETLRDIEKQLHSDERSEIDTDQLKWLEERLIESWHTEEVRGRVIYFHHPPYVTEATKWDQAQTLAIRYNLRGVLDRVSEKVGKLAQDRPIVDLAISGHAHCLEYLQTANTGGGDSNMHWLVCGGSGYSLRRQRKEGSSLLELYSNSERVVAQSKLYLGRHGKGSKKQRPYSFLRIDVLDGNPPKFRVRPFISELYQRQWTEKELDSIWIGG